MKSMRIYTIVKKFLLLTVRDFPRITDMIFWPFIDVTIWGFTGAWLQSTGGQSLPLMLLCGIVLWQVTWRTNIDVCVSLYDEISTRNLLNIFVTPLQLFEWIVAVMILGFIKTLFTVPFSAFLIWLIYGINIFSVGSILFPCALLLIISGWFIGLLTAACLFIWGQRVQSIMWIAGWVFIPFSGVFYSISVLPAWSKPISYSLPMTYIFEAMRTFVATGIVMIDYLVIACALNILFLVLALTIFSCAFNHARNRGLVQLEKE